MGLAVDAVGRRHNVDGLGYLFGDAGGGFWLGRKGIRAAVAAVEGRGPATSLSRPLAGLVGELPVGVKQLYGSPGLVGEVAAFARLVAEAALAGDAVAGALCRAAGAALAGTAVAALEHSALGPAARLATAGGVLTNGGPVHVALVDELAVPASFAWGRRPDRTRRGARQLGEASSGGLGAAHLAMATVWRQGVGLTSPGSPDPGVSQRA